MASVLLIFFFNDTATTEIYTLSLHDALPISPRPLNGRRNTAPSCCRRTRSPRGCHPRSRSEEHTSELQSQSNIVCRLLLEKNASTPALSPYLLSSLISAPL